MTNLLVFTKIGLKSVQFHGVTSTFILDVAQFYGIQPIQHSCGIVLIFARMANARLTKSFPGFAPDY